MPQQQIMVVCVQCRRSTHGYFEIVRIDATGANRGSVKVCSVVCLIQWGCNFAAQSGAQMVQGAKNLLDRLVVALRGLPK